MKLKLSLPERPGFLFFVPGLDFLGLMLAMLTMTALVANEGFVELRLPPSEFRGERLADEDPVVVSLTVRNFYIGNEVVEEEVLVEELKKQADLRKTDWVVLYADEKATVKRHQQVVDAVKKGRSKM